MIRLLLADDEQLTREAVAVLLALEADLEVVAQVTDGAAVFDAVARWRPDVAVLDVEMPGMDGVAVVERLTKEFPSVRSLLLTRHARPGLVRRALSVGARGFVSKAESSSVLADAIRRVHAGLRHVDPDMAISALVELDCPLSERELEVLRLLTKSTKAAEIAAVLSLSAGTVRNYLSSAMSKVGARNRSEALSIAHEHGWL